MRTAEGLAVEGNDRGSAELRTGPPWQPVRGGGELNGRGRASLGVQRMSPMDRPELEAARPITPHCSGPGFALLSPAADWDR